MAVTPVVIPGVVIPGVVTPGVVISRVAIPKVTASKILLNPVSMCHVSITWGQTRVTTDTNQFRGYLVENTHCYHHPQHHLYKWQIAIGFVDFRLRLSVSTQAYSYHQNYSRKVSFHAGAVLLLLRKCIPCIVTIKPPLSKCRSDILISLAY